MTEKQIFKNLANIMSLHGGQLYRMENRIGIGTPDTHYSFDQGNSGWVELKQISKQIKNRKKVTVPYRPGQIGWLKKYNGRKYVLLYMDEMYYLLTSFQRKYETMNSFLRDVIWLGEKLDKNLLAALRG